MSVSANNFSLKVTSVGSFLSHGRGWFFKANKYADCGFISLDNSAQVTYLADGDVATLYAHNDFPNFSRCVRNPHAPVDPVIRALFPILWLWLRLRMGQT